MTEREPNDHARCFNAAWSRRSPNAAGEIWVGGRRVAVRCVGERLWRAIGASLLPAPPGRADLTLDLWDGSEIDARPPMPEPRDDQLHHQGAGTLLVLLANGALVRHVGSAFDVIFDRQARRLIGWVDPGRLAPWERLRPLQELFIAALAASGRPTFHAAMVVGPGGGLLLPGASGSGKSTVAAASLAAGLTTLGDDAIAVEIGEKGAFGYALQAVVKLSVAGIAAYPSLASRGEQFDDPLGEERALRLVDLDGQVAAWGELTAIAFPRCVDDPRTRLKPVPAGACVAELLRSQLFVERGQLVDLFTVATALAAGLPAYHLEVGRDPDGIVPVVATLVGDGPPSESASHVAANRLR